MQILDYIVHLHSKLLFRMHSSRGCLLLHISGGKYSVLIDSMYFCLSSNISENFRQIVDILTPLWFTLISQNKSHDLESKDNVTSHRPSVPKNVCAELLLVLFSVLQSSRIR